MIALFDPLDDGDLHYLPQDGKRPLARDIINSDDDVFADLGDMAGDID